MELSTFGAIMKFAMDREGQIAGIVERMAGSEDLAPMRELTDRIIKTNKKNAKLLERTRREGVNEVILHSITGVDSDTYSLEDRSADKPAAREFGEYLAEISDILIRFYTDAASKITNPEAMRVFERLAAQRVKLKEDIKAYVAGLR